MTGIAQLMLAGGSVSYDAAAEALFARFSPDITAAQKAAYNTAIVALKAAGIWSTLDCMGNFCAPHSQAALQNWTENDHHGTAVNTPTFTAKSGYATDGSSSYISIDYLPNTDKVNLALNSVTLACEITAGSDAIPGAYSIGCGSASFLVIRPTATVATTIQALLNDLSTSSYTSAAATRIGLTSVSRTTSTASEGYRNGSSAGTSSSSSTAVPDLAVFIGGYNGSGSLASPIANTFAAWAIGGQWTSQQHADFNTIMVAYRTAMALT